MAKVDEMTNEDLRKYVENWRSQMIDDHNQNFVGQSYMNTEVASRKLKGLDEDMQKIFAIVEIIISRLPTFTPVEDIKK